MRTANHVTPARRATDPGFDAEASGSALSDDLLLVALLRSWMAHDGLGSGPRTDEAIEEALSAFSAGASLFEAMAVGRSYLDHDSGPARS